ncbi:MAG: hypothetical protein KBT68_04365 [bacterium]|nr:hypothetical protein [Candidatus Colisoma equi]
MMLSVLLAAAVSVSAQGFVLDGRTRAVSIEGDAVVYDSTRGGAPDTYRFGSARMRDGADGDFALVAGVTVERLDHWNSFRLTAQSVGGSGWRTVFSRIQRAPGEHLLLAQQFVNGEKTDETSVSFNGCVFSFVLVRRGGKIAFAWKGNDGKANKIAEFGTPYAGETTFAFNFDSAKATQSRVKISAVGLTAERRPPEAHLPFYKPGQISCAAIPLTGVKGRADADGSVRIAPGGRLLYAARAPVTASGWTLEWKSEGRVKIRAIQLGSAETLKLSDNVQWDDIADSVPEGYAVRNRGISPWVLRFNSDLRWPLSHPYTSGLFFFEVSPAGDEEIRFGDFRLTCRALHDPKPLEPGVGVTEYPVAGKVGAVEIVHTAGRQPKGSPDDLAGWLYVYADGTTACAYATLRWTCGTYGQDDIENRINPDTTWFGSPGFDWGEVVYESANEHGTHWNAWYRWRFVNPHPEKDVVKVQMFRLPGDAREYRVKGVTPVAAKDCTIALVEPAKAVLDSGEETAGNVYEYRADAAGADREARPVCAEKSAGVTAQVGEATLRRKGAFAAAATIVATEAEKDVPAGQVTLTAGAARSSRLSLMTPKRGDEKPLHYTMICGGHDPFADYDRMVRCGYDEAKVHMAWKVGPDGGWSADGWDERVEKIARAGMTVALRNTVPQKEFDKELKPLLVYQDGTNTELRSGWMHDTSDPFYREKLVDYYAFVGRFAERHGNVVGINANYGQRLPVANPGNDTARRAPSLVWTENRLEALRGWLRERGRDASAVTGPQAILDDAELFADYARWNEGVANALIEDISAAIRRGSKRPHLTFNVNFHPIENKLSGQTFAEYLRVGMKYGPGSLFHETSERYSLSFVKWLAAARTCGLVYGDECCQNPPSYEQAAMAYMWMGMMQCFESNYCQWWGGRPATENVAQFKAYHRMLQDAEYLPDPVCLALSFETGFREIAATAKVPLHTRTQSHYGLASCLRELNVNPDRYMLDEFPELDANVKAKLLVDDVTRAMPAAFGDRIERFVRAGGAYLAFLETDMLNGHAFLKRFGFTDAELTRTDETPFPTAERQVGAGRVVVFRKGWSFGWDPGRPADYCRAARAKLTELGAFEPLVQADHPCVSVTPYRAKDGSGLVSVINISCEDRVSQVTLSKAFAGASKPEVLDAGSGRPLAVRDVSGRWAADVPVGRINTTVLRLVCGK